MRMALIGDIHANFAALENALEQIAQDGVDEIAFLGDLVSDCPCPEKTMRLIAQAEARFPCHLIRGNREEYFLHYAQNGGPWQRVHSGTGSLRYTYEHLRRQDLAKFSAMPIAETVTHPHCAPVVLAHGSPDSASMLLRSGEAEARAYVRTQPHPYLACAHTHEQGTFSEGGHTYVNPGSLGLPLGTPQMAQYAYLTASGGSWKYEARVVSYDIRRVLCAFWYSGLLERGRNWALATIASLRTGQDISYALVLRAQEIARARALAESPAQVPEPLWDEAAAQLEIGRLAGIDIPAWEDYNKQHDLIQMEAVQ